MKPYKSYQDTKVSVMESHEQIVKILRKHGIFDTQMTNMESKSSIITRFPIQRDNGTASIRVEIKYKDGDQKDARRMARVLYNWIKAKVVAIEAGLESFTESFMPYIELPNGQTLSQQVLPQLPPDIDNIGLLELQGKPVKRLALTYREEER